MDLGMRLIWSQLALVGVVWYAKRLRASDLPPFATGPGHRAEGLDAH